MSSPLLIGCDLTTLSPETLELISNPELIALNQDALGLQAYVVKTDGTTYVLVKDVERRDSTTRAVALYNPTDSVRRISVGLDEIQLAGNASVRDLINRRNVGNISDTLSVDAPYGQTVPAGIVPPTIAAYVADNYSVTGINEISRDNRGYEVELNTGVELIFDRDGKFVRIDR